jgi:hypothetical protein
MQLTFRLPALALLLAALPLAAGCGCSDTCRYASDGTCDDDRYTTGQGRRLVCPRGTDCTDCGARIACSPSLPPYPPGGAPSPPVDWNFDARHLHFMAIFMGCFGGLWTGCVCVGGFRTGFDIAVRRRLKSSAAHKATGKVAERFTRRVSSGKNTQRTAHLMEVTFSADNGRTVSGRIREPRTMRAEIEVPSGAWEKTSVGEPWPMVYLGVEPRCCDQDPPPEMSSFAFCWITSCSPIFAALGVCFLLFMTGRSGYALVCYGVVFLLFMGCLAKGWFKPEYSGWYEDDNNSSRSSTPSTADRVQPVGEDAGNYFAAVAAAKHRKAEA